MKKPSWIIFDVGGVLLDWRASSDAVAKQLGVTHSELFDVLYDQTAQMSIGAKMTVGAISAEEGWTEILKRLGKTQFSTSDILNQWFATEYWFPASLALVGDLHRAGYKLAIMSNSWLGLTHPEKRSAFPQELQYFTHIFDSSIDKVKKPAPEFYEVVEVGTKKNGSELLLVDDDQKNLTTATSRQWQTFLFESDVAEQGEAAVRQLRGRLL
ncbi:MAG TPA: HAD family hydrolase [Candidatus Saccharimonadales bacterium]|nr:HAD family hydrolase [Candidatus Saccharimonadales bacterium]